MVILPGAVLMGVHMLDLSGQLLLGTTGDRVERLQVQQLLERLGH